MTYTVSVCLQIQSPRHHRQLRGFWSCLKVKALFLYDLRTIKKHLGSYVADTRFMPMVIIGTDHCGGDIYLFIYWCSEISADAMPHIQIFALSRWLSVNLPIEYYEFAKGIEWSIPYCALIHPSNSSRPNLYTLYLKRVSKILTNYL